MKKNLVKRLVGFLKNPKSMFKLFVCFTAVLHLVLSHLQIASISVLTNQICGFVMFFFILLGFVCLFNAIRTKEITLKRFIITTLMTGLTLGFGIWLLSIYFSSINTQLNLDVAKVMSGIVLSIIVLALYFVGYVFYIIAYIFELKHLYDDEDDENE